MPNEKGRKPMSDGPRLAIRYQASPAPIPPVLFPAVSITKDNLANQDCEGRMKSSLTMSCSICGST